MKTLEMLFENNRRWAKDVLARDPAFFKKLTHQQSPAYLWIGCADSRVPANEIVGLLPGELFVHRNVANLVHPDDTNALAVIQYAVEVLQVTHIMVCGHYCCGGVQALFNIQNLDRVDRWLQPSRALVRKHQHLLESSLPDEERWRRLSEINVLEQVMNVSAIPSVQKVWKTGGSLMIHGWIYDVADGLLQDLKVSVDSADGLAPAYERALADFDARHKITPFKGGL